MIIPIKSDDHDSGESQIPTSMINDKLFALVRAAVALEKEKTNSSRIDGCIIGTGKADFTKNNACYTLNFQGKPAQLIDVPGIEGDEGKYADMVRQAVAKAHLIIYVNGTNKKPEKVTAEKIGTYLSRGSQVCPIINVRGNADAYEFEEDRISLIKPDSENSPLTQTIGVLESILGKKALLPGHSVNGLLAFSSLAFNSVTHKTSIHASRAKDLVIHQKKYLAIFSTANAMFKFSQISELAYTVQKKSGTFKEDIIESNKKKIIELLKNNIEILEEIYKNHHKFIENVKPEFKNCKDSIYIAIHSFEKYTASVQKTNMNNFFVNLIEESNNIVEDNFGDQELITAKIQKAFKLNQEKNEEIMQRQFKLAINNLQEEIAKSINRLFQDFKRIEFQNKFTSNENISSFSYHSADLEMGLNFKKVAVNIGNYAFNGFTLGSTIPVIGNLIGVAIGAVIGILINIVDFFSSKESRIRKAQKKVNEQISELWDKALSNLSFDIKNITVPIRNEIENTTLTQIDAIFDNLSLPLKIIVLQINNLSYLKEKLEKMPHGTIQAI